MKKVNLIILIIVLLVGLIACSNQKNNEVKEESTITTEVSNDNNNEASNENDTNNDVREKVWEQLKEKHKERINGTWKDGNITKVTLNKDMMSQVKDKSYEGKEVYLINFPTNDNFEPNVIAVYADADTFNYIGHALVE